ncbi:MAG: aminopeptidase N [Gammaproteobacteria bacterium]|nr:aminopeptidase N [Gammaproteobacteria bacterium]
MKTEENPTIHLADYRAPTHRITETHMDISLDFDQTTVRTVHKVTRIERDAKEIRLNCDLMAIESVKLNDTQLSASEFDHSKNHLIIPHYGDEFTLEITNHISPSSNTALSGLYKSGDMLCTQCEAEGFRRIAPSIDRPDNLSLYTVTLSADKRVFPVLLCNGNLVNSGDCPSDRFDGNGHFTTWNDPFNKPTYLFAIVAGKLDSLEDKFTTQSGKQVTLKFFARDRDIEKCHHAMAALKSSMAWDEQVYGREYDLEIFHVVAVGDFNMGAMENKSLNIFNTKYVLADSAMATDIDFHNVESVIAHEYFHNWSGNRVTCRDWFQLSLKEGFTVFRDQEFSADMGSFGVNRINDVNVLRTHQFKEDAGPMAHPVRPASYQEINNFYTATVYNKGAEVVRMVRTLIGHEQFRQGCDLYFDRHDGEAVTTDDFIAAMEHITGQNMNQFKNWYSQAGTPNVEVATDFDSQKKQFTISLKQHCPETPGQAKKAPFVIPIRMALFDSSGMKMALKMNASSESSTEKTLVLCESEQSFVFNDIEHRPEPSLLRHFSAPVELNHEQSMEQLVFLLNHDDDPFNQWESGQKLYLNQILQNIRAHQTGQPFTVDQQLITAFNVLVMDEQMDQKSLAKILTLPSESYVSEQLSQIDPLAVSLAVEHLRKSLAEAAQPSLLQRYKQCQGVNQGEYVNEQVAARALRDIALDYLLSLKEPKFEELASMQLKNTKCMTDSASAINALASQDNAGAQLALEDFYLQWKDEPLVVDKWLRAQAMGKRHNVLDIVQSLTSHPGFDHTNPNKVYSLIMGFTHANPRYFHNEDGSGYDFFVDWVEKIDAVNPQVAARLSSAVNNWKQYKPALGEKMHQALIRISHLQNLSKDVSEIIGKCL